ncbi:MAG TPA: SDR family oxidoreductase [Chthonomonadaceae bacterium]|nr:SDR family oxidoreductase [Chthonomonadaceae bacterium]
MEMPPEEMEICLQVLQKIADKPGLIRRDDRFKGLISKIYKESKRDDQREERWRRRVEDRALMAHTAMVQIQRDALPVAALPPPSLPTGRKLNTPEACYICKKAYTDVHFFYHLLCPTCADYNHRMRDLHADLTGRTALVTGGRVKIGFQTVLRLLRDGARVIVTTRFPHTAARRFCAEPDSPEWQDRLHVYGLDLRNIPAVEAFARHLLHTEPRLDIVIHNAAQTIRRPHGFYNELIALEARPQEALSLEAHRLVRQEAPLTLTSVAESSSLLPGVLPTVGDVLPVDALEDNEERADSRSVNSWLLRLDDVSAPEMLEVQLVNSVAPFVLNSRLKPLLMRSPCARRFIVNVSAMEGQFSRHKTVFHPHTNMAKAALNMMTRTSGDDYAQDGIYMNSVDTGWVTDENPTPKRTKIQENRGFFPPLDAIDGMARIYHPIAFGITREEEPLYGLFLKDFVPCPW